MSDIQLISIIAPQLSDTQYGQSVVTQFENIDRNFKTLANHDFVKGEDGKSVKVIVIQLDKAADNTSQEHIWYNNIITTIGRPTSMTDEEYNSMISNINESYITTFQQESDNSVIGVLPYIFLDGRRTEFDDNDFSNSLKENQDQSCVIYWDTDNQSLNKASIFPTIYYNDTLGEFCWNMDGVETEIIARGPAGSPGADSIIPILAADKNATPVTVDSVEYQKVTHAYINGSWVDINSSTIETYVTQLKSNIRSAANNNVYISTILFDSNMLPDNSSNVVIWFSPLSITNISESDVLLVSMADSNKFNVPIEDTALGYYMKRISFDNPDPVTFEDLKAYLRGLFIPFQKGMTANAGAHVIYAKGTGDLKKDLYVAPMADIRDVESENTSSGATLNIKYPSVIMQGDDSNTTRGTVNYTQKDINTVFGEMFKDNEQTTIEETRFQYVYKTNMPGETLPEPGYEDKRPPISEFVNNTNKVFICPDGMLWYRDPYTYLRVDLSQSGQVKIIAPTNNINYGDITLSSNTIEIPANMSSSSFIIGCNTYWKIEEVA